MERGLNKEPGKYIIRQEKSKQKESIEMDEKVGEWTTFYRDVYYPDQN